MGKAAGFLKRLKKVKDLIGKGASWVNTNIIKPLDPIIDTALGMVPGVGGALKLAKDGVQNYLDKNYAVNENKRLTNAVGKFGEMMTSPEYSVAGMVGKGIDYLADRYGGEASQGAYGGASANAYGQSPQPKAYSNPFGQRIN